MRLVKRALWGFLALLGIFALILGVLRGMAAWHESVEVSSAMPPEGRRIETDLGMVYVEEAGPTGGIPVLLVHGSVGWAQVWVDITPALNTAGFRTVAMDLSPMGFSDPDPSEDYSRAHQAARILAVAKALKIKPILVAHSFGAGPASEAVLIEQEAFRGLVLISAAVGLGSHKTGGTLPAVLQPQWVREVLVSATATNRMATAALLKLFLYQKDSPTDAQIAILQRPLAVKGTTRAMAAWLPSLLVPPLDALSTRPESYANLTLPVALIWGDQDTTTPLEQGLALQKAIPAATLALLPEVGHIPQIEDPEALRAALVSALASMPVQQ